MLKLTQTESKMLDVIVGLLEVKELPTFSKTNKTLNSLADKGLVQYKEKVGFWDLTKDGMELLNIQVY